MSCITLSPDMRGWRFIQFLKENLLPNFPQYYKYPSHTLKSTLSNSSRNRAPVCTNCDPETLSFFTWILKLNQEKEKSLAYKPQTN